MPKRDEIDAELVSALALGASPEHAALRVGCGRRTVYRRLENPAFMARLDAARDRLGDLPADMGPMYETLASLRAASKALSGFDSSGVELTARECRKRVDESVRWLEEWCWLREIEPVAA
ncbi:MAG: hypothetical protein ACYC9L_05620 [Sulfuricaulis sp.]